MVMLKKELLTIGPFNDGRDIGDLDIDEAASLQQRRSGDEKRPGILDMFQHFV